MKNELLLDTQIRDWVLLPLLLTLFLFGLLRHYITLLFTTVRPTEIDIKRRNFTLLRSQQLEKNFKYLPLNSFLSRKYFFTNKALMETIPSQTLASFANPNNMSDMMTKNFTSVLPNILIYGFFYNSLNRMGFLFL
jgi:ER membrane protein complex subunit 3